MLARRATHRGIIPGDNVQESLVEQLTTRHGRVEARSCVSGLLMDLNEAECFRREGKKWNT